MVTLMVTYRKEGLRREINALGDHGPMDLLGGLGLLNSGWIVAEWLGVALRTRTSPHVAWRTAATTSTGASGLRRGSLRGRHLRGGLSRGVTGGRPG